MSKKIKHLIANLVIATLIVTLGLGVGNCLKALKTKPEISCETIVTDNKDIENLQLKQSLLERTFKDSTKLQVASGTISFNYNFNNQSDELTSQSASNPFKVLYNRLTVRAFNCETEYQYNFKYNLSDLIVEQHDNKLVIYVNSTNLLLEDVKENKDKTRIMETTGLLAKDFSAAEVHAISILCENKARNYLNSDADLHVNAADSLVKTIGTMCDSLSIQNYEIKVIQNNTLTMKDTNFSLDNICQSNN